MVLGAVLGTIVYRISLVAVFYGGGGSFLQRHAKIFTSMTAALINLVIIMILTRIYHRLARWMVNMENPRTQTEYEASYTFKIFLFEFVNFYSSLIYIAFFKVYQLYSYSIKRCRDCVFQMYALFREDFSSIPATRMREPRIFIASRRTYAIPPVASRRSVFSSRLLWSASSASTTLLRSYHQSYGTGGARERRSRRRRTTIEGTPVGKKIINCRIRED